VAVNSELVQERIKKESKKSTLKKIKNKEHLRIKGTNPACQSLARNTMSSPAKLKGSRQKGSKPKKIPISRVLHGHRHRHRHRHRHVIHAHEEHDILSWKITKKMRQKKTGKQTQHKKIKINPLVI